MSSQIPVKGPMGQRDPAKNAPVRAIAKVADEKALTLAQAEALTAAINKADDNLATKLVASFRGRIWEAYGLKDWGGYAAQHLGETRIISSSVRKALVAKLASAQLSNRAIAAGLGTDEKTIRNDLKARKAEEQVRNNSAPDQEPLDVNEVPDSELTNGTNGSTVDDGHAGMRQGSDGKWQPESKPPQEPKTPDLATAAKKIATDLVSLRIRLDLLMGREDYSWEGVSGALATPIGDFIDSLAEDCAGLIRDRLPEPEPAVT